MEEPTKQTKLWEIDEPTIGHLAVEPITNGWCFEFN